MSTDLQRVRGPDAPAASSTGWPSPSRWTSNRSVLPRPHRSGTKAFGQHKHGVQRAAATSYVIAARMNGCISTQAEWPTSHPAFTARRPSDVDAGQKDSRARDTALGVDRHALDLAMSLRVSAASLYVQRCNPKPRFPLEQWVPYTSTRMVNKYQKIDMIMVGMKPTRTPDEAAMGGLPARVHRSATAMIRSPITDNMKPGVPYRRPDRYRGSTSGPASLRYSLRAGGTAPAGQAVGQAGKTWVRDPVDWVFEVTASSLMAARRQGLPFLHIDRSSTAISSTRRKSAARVWVSSSQPGHLALVDAEPAGPLLPAAPCSRAWPPSAWLQGTSGRMSSSPTCTATTFGSASTSGPCTRTPPTAATATIDLFVSRPRRSPTSSLPSPTASRCGAVPTLAALRELLPGARSHPRQHGRRAVPRAGVVLLLGDVVRPRRAARGGMAGSRRCRPRPCR